MRFSASGKILPTPENDLLEEKIRNFLLDDLAKQVPGRSYPCETMLDGIVQQSNTQSGTPAKSP
jgi:hypothetical protein